MSDHTSYHKTVSKIIAILKDADCDFKTFEHDAVRTSEEAAALRPEYSLAQGAKALIVRVKTKDADGESKKKFVQIVVPGDAKFDVKKVKAITNASDIRFAHESEVEEITDGVQPGGVPPFGNLFGLAVYVDESLLLHDEIIFNAGDRRFSIAMKSGDYLKIVSPTIVDIVEA